MNPAIADSVAASWLIHNHPRYWFAILFFFRSVNAVRAFVHGEAMNLMLNAKVVQLAEMIRIVFLENRDRAAVACHVNALKAGIVFDYVAAFRDGHRRDNSVFLKVDYG